MGFSSKLGALVLAAASIMPFASISCTEEYTQLPKSENSQWEPGYDPKEIATGMEAINTELTRMALEKYGHNAELERKVIEGRTILEGYRNEFGYREHGK